MLTKLPQSVSFDYIGHILRGKDSFKPQLSHLVLSSQMEDMTKVIMN